MKLVLKLLERTGWNHTRRRVLQVMIEEGRQPVFLSQRNKVVPVDLALEQTLQVIGLNQNAGTATKNLDFRIDFEVR